MATFVYEPSEFTPGMWVYERPTSFPESPASLAEGDDGLFGGSVELPGVQIDYSQTGIVLGVRVSAVDYGIDELPLTAPGPAWLLTALFGDAADRLGNPETPGNELQVDLDNLFSFQELLLDLADAQAFFGTCAPVVSPETVAIAKQLGLVKQSYQPAPTPPVIITPEERANHAFAWAENNLRLAAQDV